MKDKIRFAHLADLHLGGWREKTLTNLNFETFCSAIDKVIDEKVDFVLFAGDIFNNALPPIELAEKVARKLMELKKSYIPLYVIGGSHDYSVNQKSFIDLFETTGLFVDVSRYEITGKNEVKLKVFKDEKTGALISGILGKKNGLDKNIYTNLNEDVILEKGFKIFMFHTTLNDIKPDFLENVKSDVKSNFLPKGFDYYAGGHVHAHIMSSYMGKPLSYPGPLFPNNFTEMKREISSFNLCEYDSLSNETKIKRVFLSTYHKIYFQIKLQKCNPIEARNNIDDRLKDAELVDKIVLLEIEGEIDGKVSDIKINELISDLYRRGAYHVLKNTYKLSSSLIDINKYSQISEDISKIQKEIINDILSEDNDFEKRKHDSNLFLELDFVKKEDEKNSQFEQRIVTSFDKVLGNKN